MSMYSTQIKTGWLFHKHNFRVSLLMKNIRLEDNNKSTKAPETARASSGFRREGFPNPSKIRILKQKLKRTSLGICTSKKCTSLKPPLPDWQIQILKYSLFFLEGGICPPPVFSHMQCNSPHKIFINTIFRKMLQSVYFFSQSVLDRVTRVTFWKML